MLLALAALTNPDFNNCSCCERVIKFHTELRWKPYSTVRKVGE
jgi:hypothetical protein